MKIGVLKETIPGENRVALVPDSVKSLVRKGHEIWIEKDAGQGSFIPDREYSEAGAKIESAAAIASGCDVILKVRQPAPEEVSGFRSGASLFAILDPVNYGANFASYAGKKLDCFAMEFIPRTTLAQSMDVLSSQATVAGYKAVLLAADLFPKFFPMLMTAAGTIPPAKVLVIGAGVAGLGAIATAKRLGASVEAFDVRAVVKEQVESLGAKFVEVPSDENLQDSQGYAKEASPEYLRRQKEVLAQHLAKSDICITTAQVFGKKAPILLEKAMVEGMKPGSLIVDLAAEQGGNCELTKAGETVLHNDVRIIGPRNIASLMPAHASKMYSKNIENLLNHLIGKEGTWNDLPNDEILNRTRVMKAGEITSDIVKSVIGG